MTKKIVAILCVAACSVPAMAAVSREKLQARMDAAKTVIQEIESVPDKAIPEQITESATCVGVVPGMLKAAFIFGGEHGEGVVTCRTGHGWSAPVFIQMTGGSWGLQIGGQATDLVLVAVNQKGFQDLLNSKFKIGAGASAAAGPVGRNASAGTDWNLNTQVLTYSRAKGLFAGLTLSGADVRRDDDSMSAFYGHHVSTRLVLGGEVATPAGADSFIKAVTSAKAQSAASGQ